MSENTFVYYDVKVDRLRDKQLGIFVSTRTFNSLFHAAMAIRKSAIASIRVSPNPSSPGLPPHTRKPRGKRRGTGRLKSSIRFEVNKKEGYALIGPISSVLGDIARAHEFGGRYKKGNYPARPFMRPALERNLHRFAGSYAGNFGG